MRFQSEYILSRTVFHIICQIIAFDKKDILFHTLILRSLLEYLHQSYCEKLDSLGHIYVGCLPSTTLM